MEIAKADNEYDLDLLSNNLEAVKELVENDYISGENEFKELYEPLIKLSDHINLEIGRYNYYSANERKVMDYDKKIEELGINLNNSTTELKEAEEKLSVTQKELNEAKERLSTVQTELISVLSIFAAIVFTFSGGLTLIGNAFGEINEAPVVKNILILLVSGFIVFNVVFLMMYIVGKITKRSIYARCESENCTCENGHPKCWILNRLRKRLPYVFWINAVVLGLILVDVAVWIVLVSNDIPLP